VKKSPFLLLLALAVAAVALSACGGGGGSSSSGDGSKAASASSSWSSTTANTSSGGASVSNGGSDEAAIEETLTKAVTTNDPAKCTELQTPHYNEETGTFTAAEGLEVCEKANETEQPPAEGVELTSLTVEGEKATVEAAFEGSTLNGQTVALEMIKEAGQWKLNQFLLFIGYNPQAAAEGIEERLAKAGEPAQLVKCMGEGYAGLSQQVAEEVSMESNIAPLEALLQNCE
jgi:hypothetical protein